MFAIVRGFRAVDGSNESATGTAPSFPRWSRRQRRLTTDTRTPSARALLALLAATVTLAALADTILWMGSAAPPAAAAAPAAKNATTTTSPAGSTPADTWILKAVAAEQHVGSVQVAGKITQGKSQILLQLLVNGDGEGGGEFVQQGSLIKIERVGPLLYFNAPAKFWATHASAAQTKKYGGKWIELSAVDPRFTSFDQFLDAADLVVAAFQGHTAPLTVSRPTTFAGHRVVVVKDTVTSKGKTSTGLMYISANGPALVYKIVDDTPGNVSTVVFDHYGKGSTLTVPPNAINLS
jgi:hypothetical protein